MFNITALKSVKYSVRLLWVRFKVWLRPYKPSRWKTPEVRRKYKLRMIEYNKWKSRKQMQACYLTLMSVLILVLYSSTQNLKCYVVLVHSIFTNEVSVTKALQMFSESIGVYWNPVNIKIDEIINDVTLWLEKNGVYVIPIPVESIKIDLFVILESHSIYQNPIIIVRVVIEAAGFLNYWVLTITKHNITTLESIYATSLYNALDLLYVHITSIQNTKQPAKKEVYESLWVLKLPNISSLAVYITTTVLYVLVGGTIPLFERKYLSLMQRRVGPKFVGYNGRLQILADALKLLLKELIVLKSTNTFLFVTMPLLTLTVNLLLCFTIVWAGAIHAFDSGYTILLVLVVELVTTVITTYIGILTKNKYTLIASIRIINGTIVFEVFLLSVLGYFYVNFDTTGFSGAFSHPTTSVKLFYFWTALGAIFHFILLLLKKVPFDIIEAETEIIMGYTSEHSGFLSGAMILVEYLHLLVWSYFILGVFLV